MGVLEGRGQFKDLRWGWGLPHKGVGGCWEDPGAGLGMGP